MNYRQKKKNLKKKLAEEQVLRQEIELLVKLANASVMAAQGIEKICSAIKTIELEILLNKKIFKKESDDD